MKINQLKKFKAKTKNKKMRPKVIKKKRKRQLMKKNQLIMSQRKLKKPIQLKLKKRSKLKRNLRKKMMRHQNKNKNSKKLMSRSRLNMSINYQIIKKNSQTNLNHNQKSKKISHPRAHPLQNLNPITTATKKCKSKTNPKKSHNLTNSLKMNQLHLTQPLLINLIMIHLMNLKKMSKKMLRKVFMKMLKKMKNRM